MDVLVLGGGEFIGRHVVEELQRAGNRVTVLNRGRSRLPAGAERILGDRFGPDGGVAGLRGTTWDAVVDVTGYLPTQVAAVLDAVEVRRRYLLVSSHAVYTLDDVGPGADEDCPRRASRPDAAWPLDNDTYGPAKVACEDLLTDRLGDRATLVRPGKVAGPYDNQEGLGHWVTAVHRGGPIAVPHPEQPVQLTDARDLAVLMRRLLDDDRPGAFQAVGVSMTIAEALAECAAGLGLAPGHHEVVLGDPAGRYPLLQADRPWSSRRRSNARAMAAGMPLTPLRRTARDWWRARSEAGSELAGQ